MWFFSWFCCGKATGKVCPFSPGKPTKGCLNSLRVTDRIYACNGSCILETRKTVLLLLIWTYCRYSFMTETKSSRLPSPWSPQEYHCWKQFSGKWISKDYDAKLSRIVGNSSHLATCIWFCRNDVAFNFKPKSSIMQGLQKEQSQHEAFVVCRSLEVVSMKIFVSYGWRSNAKLEGAWFVNVLFLRMFMMVVYHFSICKVICKRLQKVWNNLFL